MQIILLERVENLGFMGQEVTVKDGYARNFLLPRKKALRATEANRKRFEAQRVEIEARNLERRQDAEKAAKLIEGASATLIRQASEAGHLYGSVSARDIAEALALGGYKVEKNQVVLNKPIKDLGIHSVKVSLHPEVQVTISVNVARSELDAARQEKGAEAFFEAEAVFEAADDAEPAEAEENA